ncbi:ATP-binding protein [Methylobacter svalbardensis]|uniref:AAA family ATPase n=1 Tax=Methylobacter svalbardensis TaxID=3080016 RepID=UPI0030ECF729
MLIEFKVANFRSIREVQTLSLVADNIDKDMTSALVDRQLPGLSGVKFLKGAAIYGANASGKSNIIEAISFLAEFVKRSATKLEPGDATGTEPFKLDQTSSSKPSEFEITFFAEDIRFVFGVVVTPQRVLEEYLVAYPKGSPQKWYHRTFIEADNRYAWASPSTRFKDDKSLRDKTRENNLFLSVGPQWNHPQLSIAFDWFRKKLKILHLNAGSFLHNGFTANLIKENPEYHERILNLLRSADIGVMEANIQEKEVSVDDLKKSLPPSLLERLEKDEVLKAGKRFEINLLHKADGIEPVSLDFDDEESAGTRRFFALIGPWLDILDNGYTVFVDELETSLHPILVKELLKLLFCNNNNPNGAQVIFSTHNTVLLDSALLRRDQIWFTEKTPTGTTNLYPLTDYQPRKDEALAKGYLAGRYGAIPYLYNGLML